MGVQKVWKCRTIVPAPAACAAVLLLVAFSVIAVADPYVGGVPLTTVREGVVSGDLWFDHAHPMVKDWTHEYTLPAYSDIEWARLYVLIYCGSMTENYSGRANITFNSVQLGGTPDNLSSAVFNVSYSFPGVGGTGPVWVNDHCVRVTSDYLMWYDVTGLVQPTSNIHVYTWPTHPNFDGRVKGATLVVAYNDGDSDTVHYWVNQGHDTDSYLCDDNLGVDYVGVTNFAAALSSGSVVQSANLTVVHYASTDGTYTFNGVTIPTDPSETTTPPGENWQGGFSGYNSWMVASLFTSNGNNSLTYNRTGDYTYYKITQAFLTANYEEYEESNAQTWYLWDDPYCGTPANDTYAHKLDANMSRAGYGESNQSTVLTDHEVAWWYPEGPALVDVYFGDKDWVAELYYEVSPHGSGTIYVEIFSINVTNGTIDYRFAYNSTTVTGTTNGYLNFTVPDDATTTQTVLSGHMFAVRLRYVGTGDFTIWYNGPGGEGGTPSRIMSPILDPGYPVPELASGLLLALGLLLLLGLCGLRKNRRE